MNLTETDVRNFISGMANTFSLMDALLSEDEVLAGELLSAILKGDKDVVERLLEQMTIKMDYAAPGDDVDACHELSFQIGAVGARLEIAKSPLARVGEESE